MINNAWRARTQDFLLALLFLAIAALVPEHDPWEVGLILLVGAVQIGQHIIFRPAVERGRIAWNLLNLVVGYLLVGYTTGVTSNYYLVLLFPVISAAASAGVVSTLVFTALAFGAYLSFLLYIDWRLFDMHPDQVVELARRLLFLAISGLLVNAIAVALREQSVRYKVLADELAESNRNLREAEAQVRRGERLAALGQLTAGLAHELRNPLGTIKASAEMLEKNVPREDAVAFELAGYISSEVDRTNSLVSRFLDFARPLQLIRTKASIQSTIERAIRAAQREAAARRISFETRIDPIPDFIFDPELMERALFNLIENAVQASGESQRVAVAAFPIDSAAEITVRDSGSGISNEHLEAIFNPFFTTKASGTGLGLAIVAKIVDEHGGKLKVESTKGAGSVFTVRLPMEQR